MKLGWLAIGLVIVAGCTSSPLKMGEEEDGVVDLNRYQLYIEVVEEYAGEVVWEWAAVDEKFCDRHQILFVIIEVESGDHTIQSKKSCGNSGTFESEIDKIYEFQWDGIPEITYDIVLN